MCLCLSVSICVCVCLCLSVYSFTSVQVRENNILRNNYSKRQPENIWQPTGYKYFHNDQFTSADYASYIRRITLNYPTNS